MNRILILILITCLGWGLYYDPGYLMLAYSDWRIEMPLWLVVAALLLLIIIRTLITSFFNTLSKLIKLPRKWRHNNAKENTELCLLHLAHGHWAQAEKSANKGRSYYAMPITNYLVAAYAAIEQRSFKKAYKYLDLAQQNNFKNNNSFAIDLMRARLHYYNEEATASLAILNILHDKEPKNTAVLKLLNKISQTNPNSNSSV